MYQIDKDVELPSTGRSSVYPFSKMEVGDSFLVATDDKRRAASLRACASTYAKKNSVKFTCKQVDGGVRVWRTA